jgi:hypothetical protein
LEVGCTLLELAISHNHFTVAAMLIALGGRFTPGRTLEQLQQQECTGGPDNVSEVRLGLNVQQARQARQCCDNGLDMHDVVLYGQHDYDGVEWCLAQPFQ